MLNYPVITQSYPQAIIIAFAEYYQPLLRWQQIDHPVDAILQFGQFESQIRQVIGCGATQLGFIIQDANRAQYTIHVSTKKLTGNGRIKAGNHNSRQGSL